MNNDLIRITTVLFAMIFSLSVHEAAHALAAKLEGDDTAERQGRLTLNPAAHIDFWGTLVLPIMGMMANAMILGWAKPVPIDERNFRHRRLGQAFVAMAGPVSNLIMTFLCCLGLVAYQRYLTVALPEGSFLYPLVKLTGVMVYLNAGLAFINLVPLYPLDGGQTLMALLPRSGREWYETYIVPYGFMILILLMMTKGLAWVSAFAGWYVELSSLWASRIIGVFGQ